MTSNNKLALYTGEGKDDNMILANGLTERQEKFSRFYLDTEGNASEAYRMAYGAENSKPESVWTNASHLLKDEKIRTRIEELRAERIEESKVERKKVEAVLMDIVTADLRELYVTDPATGEVKLRTPQQLPERIRHALKKMAANSAGEMIYELHGKVEAARLLATMNGWTAPQQLQISGEKGILPLELRIGFDDSES